MKFLNSILAVVILLWSCTSEEADKNLDLAKAGDSEIWKQVAVRYPATGELIPVSGNDAIHLRISGEDVLMVTDSSSCKGKISGTTIQLDYSCSYISPLWLIVEQTKDRMFIYPRMGAMYYFDYVMERLDSSACPASPRCNLKPEVGPCEAIFPKYYFDKTEGKCKEFSWGGCDGVIPFNTLTECLACECTASTGK